MRGARAVAAAAVILCVGATAGCARDAGGTAEKAPSASPSGLTDMEKKVAAAESALAQADKDAAQDDH